MDLVAEIEEKKIALVKAKLEKYTPSLMKNFANWMERATNDPLVVSSVVAATTLSVVGSAMLSDPATPLLAAGVVTPGAYLLSRLSGVISGAMADRKTTNEAREIINEAKEISSSQDILLLRRISELQPDNLLVNDCITFMAGGTKSLDDFWAHRKEHYAVAWREEKNLQREGEVLRYIQNEIALAGKALDSGLPLDAFMISRMQRRSGAAEVLRQTADVNATSDFKLGLKIK